MPRTGRSAPGGIVFHVLNRGNGRMRLFHKDDDYAAFLKLLEQVKEAVSMRVLAYCVMSDHWHLVLWPRKDGDLSRFMLRLTTAHVRRHHAQYHHGAGGHLYQGRYKSFPVQADDHLLAVCRYVEANALRGKLVTAAGRWPWCSAHNDAARARLIDEWPMDKPVDWPRIVNSAARAEELDGVRTSIARGRPYGSPRWTAAMAKKLALQFTLRPRGRPSKNADN